MATIVSSKFTVSVSSFSLKFARELLVAGTRAPAPHRGLGLVECGQTLIVKLELKLTGGG